MDIEIVEEAENPMLHRQDVTFELIHDEATPSRLSVRDSLAARLGKSADEVVIRSLDTKFGMRRTVGTAKVYETPSHAQDIEQDYMLERNKIGAADGEVTTEDAEEPAAEAEDEPEPTQADDSEADGDDAEAAETGGDEADVEDEDDAETDADAEPETDAETEEA